VNIKNDEATRKFTGYSVPVSYCSLTPDYKYASYISQNGKINFLNIANGRETDLLPANTYKFNSKAVSSDGKLMLTGIDEKVILWDMESRKEIKSFAAARNSHLEFSPDNKYFMANNLWDIETGKMFEVSSGNTPSSCYCFSPEGNSIAYMEYYRIVKIWDKKTSGTRMEI